MGSDYGNANGRIWDSAGIPGHKMAAFGSNWRYSPLTQVNGGSGTRQPLRISLFGLHILGSPRLVLVSRK